MEQHDNVVEEIPADLGFDIRKVQDIIDKENIDESVMEEMPPQDEGILEQPQIEEILLSPEEIAERSGLMNYFKIAKTKFPDDWAVMGISDDMLNSSDNETLKLMKDDFEFRSDSAASFDSLVALANKVILIAEGYSVAFGLELGGLSRRLQENPDYNLALSQVIHRYGSKYRMTPTARLAAAILMTGYQVHMENTAKKTLGQTDDAEYQSF